jgi:hypothetical protein
MKTLIKISSIFILAVALTSCSSNSEKSAELVPDSVQIEISSDVIIDSAQSYAQSTQMQLSQNLMAAMVEGGPVNAISFCNERAIPLTDSMSTNFGVTIRRVSDRPRNASNQANKDEMAFIEIMKTAMINGEQPKPDFHRNENSNTAYLPILTNGLCLKCHGVENQEIDTPTLTKLNELYPQDQARGYGNNELRGIWVINMPNK